jgi:short-subunit dehydrogenase
MSRIAGRVVLVTGASSGIGEATALALGRTGARVALVARRADRLAAVARAVEAAGGTALAVPADVTVAADVAAAVARTVADFGRLDVLVSNAGAAVFATVAETTAADLRAMLAVNLESVFHGVKAALPVMRRQGAGHIVNVASTAGRRGSPYVGAYCAAKFGVVGLTEALRTELLGTGIRVSLVLPGATRTPFFDVAVRRTAHHVGLVGPVESAEQVAARIVRVIRRPGAEAIAQPLRRRLLLAFNLFAPAVVDRLVLALVHRGDRRAQAGSRPR